MRVGGSSSSMMGPQHEALARSMTVRASAAALAACAVLALAVTPLLLALPLVLAVYIASEAVFVVIYWFRYLLLSYQPVKHRPLVHDPIASWQRTLQHLQQDNADIRAFLSIWFHGAPISSIKRENVKSLIAYAFWFKTPAEVDAEGRAHELEQQVSMLEDMWGLRLQPGYDQQLTCMCHLWEPMKHWYRPLAFYLAMEAVTLLVAVALQAAGFSRHRWMGITYYSRNMPAELQPRQSAEYSRARTSALPVHAARAAGRRQRSSTQEEQEVPLVLLHGIGMGLLPYVSVLFNLAATGRPVLALELAHISQRFVLWVPTLDEVTEVLLSILNRSSIHSCCLVGHSYGSAVASRLLQQAPARIKQLCLIDPIVFSMFMPNLLRNFLYDSPRSGSMLGDFMMVSAARELHVSATLSRRFFWTDCNLFGEQVPADTLVVLSGRDALMAAAQVRSWLEEHTQAVVMYHPDLAHAGCLLDIPWQQQILQQLLLLLDSKSKSGPAGGGSGSHDASAPAPPSNGQPGVVISRTAGHTSRANGGNSNNTEPALHAAGQGSSQCLAGTVQAVGLSPGSTSTSRRGSSDSQRSYTSCEDQSGGSHYHDNNNSSRPSPFSLDTSPLQLGSCLGSPCSNNSHNINSSSSSQLLPFSSGPPLLTQLPMRSLEGSLEMASPLCMRSWSGVLPFAAAPAAATDASTTSAADTGVPESPLSCNTFVSASSVQSRRSAAAAAAAQQAAQAAHMLLQPLLAIQQHRQQARQQRVPAAAEPAEGPAAAESPEQPELVQRCPSAAGVHCLVSCSSAADDDKPGHNTAPEPEPATVTTERPLGGLLGLRARRVGGGRGAGAGGAAGGGSEGMLRRVEGLLQGRHGKGLPAARNSTEECSSG